MAPVQDIFSENLEKSLQQLREKRPRILAVDDEQAMLNVHERILSDEYEIHTAISGAQGLEILEQNPDIELILSDQRMPVMSGTEFLNRSMAVNPNCVRIILTGYTDIKDLVDSINSGRVFQYITKPFEPDELRMNIRRGIDFFRKGRELQIAYEEIQRAYRHLRDTQDQLIRSEKMSMLGRLMSNVAHEIRNPISNINNAVKLFGMDWPQLKEFLAQLHKISDGGLSPEQVKRMMDELNIDSTVTDLDAAMGIIANSCELASEIVEDLRGFSRLDDKQFVDTDVNHQINRALKLLKSKFKHQVEFIKELGDVPPILGLPGPVAQALINIINNAGQAVLPQGNVLIRSYRNRQTVNIEIIDNGTGIAPDHLEKIFEYGFTTKKENEGTGLGLAISYDIVKKHNGEIQVESELGKGTTFRLLFPINTNSDDVIDVQTGSLR